MQPPNDESSTTSPHHSTTTTTTALLQQQQEPTFATPDRKDDLDESPPNQDGGVVAAAAGKAPPTEATVTPPESAASQEKKHVHFGAAAAAAAAGNSLSKSSKRGLVSRRGGRHGGSPSRPTNEESGGVLEFKTYRSPPRKNDGTILPSLCSLSDKQQQQQPAYAEPIITPGSTKEEDDDNVDKKQEATATTTTTMASNSHAVQDKNKKDHRRPSSISLDASMMLDTPSPLASHDDVIVDESSSPVVKNKKRLSSRIARRSSSSSKTAEPTEEEEEHATTTHQAASKRNVTFSPPPPPSEPMMRMDSSSNNNNLPKTKTTPNKSPSAGRFHTLPSLQESKLSCSPGGIFLSPHPPSPSSGQQQPVPSFDRNEEEEPSANNNNNKQGNKASSSGDHHLESGGRPMQDAAAAAARDQERDRAVATPTDFAFDFGRGGHQHSASFDASNVLAWLQSPTANGMFSPGGLGSVSNTPRGGGLQLPRTPRTPTTTTSFFFSDVASLPRHTEFSPARDSSKRGGYSNNSMICISPLSSRARGNGGVASGRSSQNPSHANTPMNTNTNYRDVFASPRQQPGGDSSSRPAPRGLPLLGESPKGGITKGRTSAARHHGNTNLESVHMAERDLMEDEDLSVLLQLASHSTPRSARDAGTGSHVFRSGGQRKDEAASANLPGLQLPVIGGRMDGRSTKLARKNMSRDSNPANDFRPPPLAIRSSSSSGSKDVYLSGAGKGNPGDKRKLGSQGGGSRKVGGTSSATGNTTYSIPGAHPPYPHGGSEPPPYYPLPGQMPAMPPGGSMRVVVGGPQPVVNGRLGQSSSGSPPRHPGQGSSPLRPYGDGRYGRPPHYAPHMYPPHHMGGMPAHHYSHYPPPPAGHMPMYASQQHPAGKGMTKKGKSAANKTGKRPADGKEAAAAKRIRKSPTKGPRKKKATSPGDPVDRQKAAAAIAAVNAASGGNNDKAAALAAAIMRGVTMRPSGKWQAQLYYAGKSRYIGVFDTREKAALAYEIAREKLKDTRISSDQSAQSIKATEAAVNLARKAAFEGVNETDRIPSRK